MACITTTAAIVGFGYALAISILVIIPKTRYLIYAQGLATPAIWFVYRTPENILIAYVVPKRDMETKNARPAQRFF